MLKKTQLCVVCALFAFIMSGCVVRTYKLTRDRIDQDLKAGNRGYLIGNMPAEEAEKQEAGRKPTRTTRIVEVEMHAPLKFSAPKKDQTPSAASYEYQRPERNTQEDYGYTQQPYVPRVESTPEATQEMESYTVQKGDTLQKISQKFFGTTKKWLNIYNANKDRLKGPDKIYPGQVINIPKEGAASEVPAGLK